MPRRPNPIAKACRKIVRVGQSNRSPHELQATFALVWERILDDMPAPIAEKYGDPVHKYFLGEAK